MTKPASWFHVDRSDDESEKDKRNCNQHSWQAA